MAKIKIKVTAEDVAKANEGGTGDFDVPKPGLYVLQCGACEPGYTKGEDGQPDQSRPYLKFTYQIVGEGREEAKPKGNYGYLWDYMSFSPTSGWKRAQVLKAYGIDVPDGQDFTYEGDTDEDFLNRKVLARVKAEKGRTKDDPPSAKIATLFPLDADLSASEAGEVDYGTTDEEDAAADARPSHEGDGFGAADEPGDDDPYTEEELKEMPLKDLGEILTELGGDPKAHIVRNGKKVDNDATMAAVISAILEAQESGDEGDEEDPF